MLFGVCLPNFGPKFSADGLVSIARAAEELGFDSVWTTDHLLVPKDQYYPYGRLIETLSSLSFLAAKTDRLRLGTSVLILAMRNPIVVAKEVAAIDILSRGRMVLGLGAGWMEKEFDFVGARFERRGSYLDESIRLMRTLWSDEVVNFNGRFFKISEGIFEPKPFQKGGPPIWIGGNSESAIKRAARYGDGWHPVGPDPVGLKERIGALAKLAGRRLDVVPRVTVELNETKPKKQRAPSGEPRYALTGPVGEVIEDMGRLKDAGANGIVCFFGDKDTLGYLERMKSFAREVMPSF